MWVGSRAYFRSDLIKGQRSSRGQSALEMPYGYQIWLEEPLTRAYCIAEIKRSRMGQPGSTRGQFA